MADQSGRPSRAAQLWVAAAFSYTTVAPLMFAWCFRTDVSADKAIEIFSNAAGVAMSSAVLSVVVTIACPVSCIPRGLLFLTGIGSMFFAMYLMLISF